MDIEKIKLEINFTTAKYKKRFALNYFMAKKFMEKVDMDFDKIINENNIIFPNITKKRSDLKKITIGKYAAIAVISPIYCYSTAPYEYAKLQGEYIEGLISK